MASASAVLSEMQMVAVGRMRVGGCVVVIDDNVAAVLAADSKLLAGILNAGYVLRSFCFCRTCIVRNLPRKEILYALLLTLNGTTSALRIISLDALAATCRHLSPARQEKVDYVVLVSDLCERVHAALLALQGTGGSIKSVQLTAPSSLKRCAKGELKLGGDDVWLRSVLAFMFLGDRCSCIKC